MVDAARWQKRWWHNGLERAQVSTATQLHLNWTHTLDAARLRMVESALREVNARAAHVTIEQYAADLHDLATTVRHDTARGGRSGALWASRSGERREHRHPFGSASLPLPAVVDRAAFERFVEALPEAVVRAKGLVRFADEPGPMYVWHRVPGKQGVSLDRSWPHADALPTALFIGVEMPVAQLAEQIAQLTG